MPFTGASDPDLPSNVSDLSLETRRQWVGAWNGRFRDCRADGGSVGDCESSAFAVANAAIKEAAVQDTAENKKNMTTDGPEYWDFVSRQIEQGKANYSPTGGSAEKACANCQWFISPAACAVVSNYPDPITPNGISDLWRERVNPFEQMEPLEVVVVGRRTAEAGSKQETKREAGVDYPAADFAVVPDTGKPSTWKLRLAEGSTGSVTVAQVARAITAMQPGGFRGNRVSLTSDQKSQAIGRIGRAIGRTDGTDEQKTNLRERLDGVKAKADWFEILVTGPKALKDTITKSLLALQAMRAKDGDNGADQPLTYDSSLTLFKEHDGTIRFIALMSNRYRDRDKEIIRAAAHIEFVNALEGADYKDANGNVAMEAWLWHTPGTRWGSVDWAHYVNGFMVVSGPVDKGFEDVAVRLAADDSLGISHGFKYLTDEGDRSIITHYRSFEFSPLPRAVASNPYTDLAVIQEEVKAMAGDKGIPEDKRAFLAEKLGEQRVADLETDTATRDASLQGAGVDFKAAESKTAEPKDDGAAGDKDTGGETLDVLAKAAAKAIIESKAMTDMVAAIKQVADVVAAQETRLAALEKSDDAKVGDLFKSRVGSVADHRASQSKDNVVKEEEAEAAGAPKFDIFSAVADDLAETAGIPKGR